MQTFVRVGNVDYPDVYSFTLPSYYINTYSTFNKNPATGTAWTVADVDALEAGMGTMPANGGANVASVYVGVSYAPLGTNCSDTDGGFNVNVQGTASGYLNSQPYSNTDYCESSTTLREFYCANYRLYNSTTTCYTNSTSPCVNGACV